MLDINNLRAGKAENLKRRFRVRMFDKISVPVVCEIQEVHEKLLLIDLPQAEGYEAKVLEAKNAELQLILADNSNAALAEEEKENLPQGCEKASENLKVTFLSIEKLDKLAADNQARMEENGFEMTSLDRFADFDPHLVPQREAHCLLNELTQKSIVAENEQPLSLIIFSEGASRHNNVLFFGFQWRAAPAKGLTTFKGRYMGDYHSSINRLERLESSFRQFLLDQTKCRCRFDALQDTVLVEKSGNFIPAMFIIETEWLKEKRSGDRDAARKMHTDNLFVMPPGNTAATIRFKPGWMDPRIALTNRINELRYLAELANNLKSGTLPWSKNESSKDQPEIVDSLNQLISGAKNKLDAQPVYPFDFTDRLWDLLKTVKSTDTLRQCFQLIYDQLQTGEFHVLVESNKVSSLAKMLRMRNPNDIIFPRLEPMACLQLLVEIGIDRFNGELAYRYSSGQYLPNSFDLDPFFPFAN